MSTSVSKTNAKARCREIRADVWFIDAALAWTFERCFVDAVRIALAGFSDGASYALRYRFAPSAAVAYEESELLLQLGKHGLRLLEGVRHGTWSGRRDGLSYQDLVVVGK